MRRRGGPGSRQEENPLAGLTREEGLALFQLEKDWPAQLHVASRTGAIFHSDHDPALAGAGEAVEARDLSGGQFGFQTCLLGLEHFPAFHLVGVLFQEDSVEFVELGLGCGSLSLQPGESFLQGLDGGLERFERLGDRGLQALFLVQLPDGGGVVHLLAGGLDRGAGAILIFLGLGEFPGFDQDLSPGGFQGSGLLGDLLFGGLDPGIQEGEVWG